MELLEGEPLDALLNRRPLSTDEILAIGIGISDALDAAHSQGVMHRDMKPANIFISGRGEPKILDFGLAKAVVDSDTQSEGATHTVAHLTSPGTAMGDRRLHVSGAGAGTGDRPAERSVLFRCGAVSDDHAQAAVRRRHRRGDLRRLIPLDSVSGTRAQLWYISYPGGEARRFTNDLTDYSRPSFDQTADGKMIVIAEESVQQEIEILGNSGTEKPRAVTARGGVRRLTWGRDATLFSWTRDQIFSIDVATGATRQLTAAGTVNLPPSGCGDGSVIYQVFNGNQPTVWRMDADGTNARQIAGEGFAWVECGADGKWFMAPKIVPNAPMQLARIATSDGKATTILDNITSSFANVSHAGTMIGGFVWPSDGSAAALFTVVPTGGGASNVWEAPLAGGTPRQVTSFDSLMIGDFAWSRDGKTLAIARGTSGSDVIVMTNFEK
jgi:protein kinase-like protein